MINWSNYVGIPYKFNSSDKTGCDCTGLAGLVYRDQGWKPEWTDGRPVDKEWFHNEPLRLLLFLNRNFDKTNNINELTEGDIIYLKYEGEGHVCIYTNYNKFLTTWPPPNHNPFKRNTISFIDRLQYWQQYVVCYFKRRKE